MAIADEDVKMLLIGVVVGLVILLFVMFDVLVTTLTTNGAGSMSGRLSYWLWWIALRIHRRHSSHRLLTVAGWVILMGTPLVWIFLTWVGWAVLFCGGETAVVNSESDVPATVWERIYFTGYTLSTLGVGDYQAQGAIWQLATALASANGFFLFTLAIAYLLPVIAAVVVKRQIALYISALGGTADDILIRAWNGKDFGQLSQHLIVLTPMLTGMVESYLAYPILNYFHGADRAKSFVLSVVTLDEALTLLYYGVEKSCRPDQAALNPLRRASSAFLKTLKSAYVEPASENPTMPPLSLLRDQGVPIVTEQEFLEATKQFTLRRKLLLALVKHDGWSWESVSSTATTSRASSLDDEMAIEDAKLN